MSSTTDDDNNNNIYFQVVMSTQELVGEKGILKNV